MLPNIWHCQKQNIFYHNCVLKIRGEMRIIEVCVEGSINFCYKMLKYKSRFDLLAKRQ